MAWIEPHQRWLVMWIFCFAAGPRCLAQEDAGALRKQVATLTAENRELRNLISVYRFTLKMQNAVVRESRIDDQRTCKLIIAQDGWGNCRAEDVAAVCGSCAETIFAAIPPFAGNEPTVLILRDAQGPMAVSQPGLNGEHFVLLNSGDRLWAQIAYQFSHELGHVLCGDRSTESPQMWFEEAFCESLSLWTMDRLGISWQTKAPYENWQSYATSLGGYADNVRTRVAEPTSVPEWFREHRNHLTSEAHDRDKNLVVAKLLAAAAHENPEFYRAFLYLRHGSKDHEQDISMEALLKRWQAESPPDLKFAASKVAELLGLLLE